MPMDAGITTAFDAAREYRPGRLDWLKIGWSARGHSTVSEKADAEEGVRLAYDAAGFAPPQIVWCGGPVELAHAWASAAPGDAGANARQILLDQPCREALRRIARIGENRAGLMRTLFQGERSRVMSAAVQEAVLEEAGDIRPPLLAWMNRPRRCGAMRWGGRPAFADAGYGPRELCGFGHAAHVAEAIDGGAGRGMRGVRLIAESAGWLVPHERVCWLSLRPDVLSADKYGRLHCGSGPALRYRDGWALYAWKGASVPAWIIMQPKKITPQWIDAQIDPRVRHAMIDIFTPARFIAEGGADATRDETGTLWKRKWSHRGVVIDSWAAVEVDTEKGMFRCVPADLGTPREAFAWIATFCQRR